MGNDDESMQDKKNEGKRQGLPVRNRCRWDRGFRANRAFHSRYAITHVGGAWEKLEATVEVDARRGRSASPSPHSHHDDPSLESGIRVQANRARQEGRRSWRIEWSTAGG